MREELIDDINDSPSVSITTQFSTWENGAITVEAESSDPDGQIRGVQFEYSFNQVAWTAIGSTITAPPYSATWDTTTSVPEVKQNVWVKAIASDDDGALKEYIAPKRGVPILLRAVIIREIKQ